jgi:hypothetical protein
MDPYRQSIVEMLPAQGFSIQICHGFALPCQQAIHFSLEGF